jgi:hypothetical protein
MTTTSNHKKFDFGNMADYSVDDGEIEQPPGWEVECNALHSAQTSVRQPGRGLLDFKHINRIPVVDVAQAIGYKIEGNDKDKQIVCPRSSEHKNKSQRFLTILGSNKVVCRLCDTYPLSVLDMVREFDRIEDLTDAAECIAFYFPIIPEISPGSHLRNPTWDDVPPGCKDPLILLTASGIWAQLTVPAQRLIPVSLAFASKNEESTVRVSYRALQRYSGIESPNSIRAAVTELEAIGFLKRRPLRARGNSPVKETAEYYVTPLSDRLREFANRISPQFGDAILIEKATRRQKRLARQSVFVKAT